ncbi:MAG: arabinan endo-1,5-alpha-L-arabinosidase [Lentisphaeria bacterium]|nr:arabinan endo-1,5-alpha-L-arabinosidase [Lentisphaeria bacterium]
MISKTILTTSLLAAALACSLSAAEPVLEFKVNRDAPRTAGMLGPSHDEEMIYGRGSDGKEHYFAVGTDVRGHGITIWRSDDLVNWKDVGKVFTRENAPKILNFGPRGWSYEFNAVKIDDKGEYEFLTERSPGANNYRLGSNQPFWAPCIYYNAADRTYYLYYSCSAYGTRNSFIGCAKSRTLDKGWEDCGQLIHTRTGDGKLYNAIDPTVFKDAGGKLWMIYGSFFGGIALVELDPKDPAKLLHPGTHGKTIACRGYEKVYEQDGFQGNPTTSVRGEKFSAYGIEGASIVYNSSTKYYYLFVSYDRLDWTYHVRVGRSKEVEGPYLDYNGRPLMYDQEKQGPEEVNGTKLIGPYRWKSTGAGWVGTGHTTLFRKKPENDFGSLFFGSNCKWQGVPGSFVGLRRVFWSDDGWPMLSPCIYAGEDTTMEDGYRVVGDELVPVNTAVGIENILNSGDSAQWDFIVFSVTDDTTFRRIDESTVYTLRKDGTIEGGGKWTLDDRNAIIKDGLPWKAPDGTTQRYARTYWPSDEGIRMTVELPNGVKANGSCAYGWDQDRKCQTVFFTGLTDKGIAVWGQRIPPEAKPPLK